MATELATFLASDTPASLFSVIFWGGSALTAAVAFGRSFSRR